MNAETQITAAVAALRGANGPTFNSVAAGPTRAGDRAPAYNKTRTPNRVMAAPPGSHRLDCLWPARPRIARTGRAISQNARTIGARPSVIAFAAMVLCAGAIRVASYLGSTGGPVVVHLVWPV